MSNKTPPLVFQGQLDRELIDVLVSQGWSPQRVVDINELMNQAVGLSNECHLDTVCIAPHVSPQVERLLETPVLVLIPSMTTNLKTTEAQTAQSTHQKQCP